MKVTHTFINIFFLSGTAVLLIFTVLAGSSSHSPMNRFYWLKADTSNIRNAPTESAWTFWGVCEKDDYSSCSLGPAFPISPVDNFRTTRNVPQKFIDDRDTFYYLGRFSFAFTIIALCFTGFALIIDILAFCFNIIDKVVITLVSIALLFLAGVVSMQTAVVVLARDAFKSAGLSAHIGVKSMAILWTSFVTLLIVFVNTFASNIANSYRKHMDRVKIAKGENADITPTGPNGDESSFTRSPPEDPETKEDHGGIRFFKIKRNHKTSDEESV